MNTDNNNSSGVGSPDQEPTREKPARRKPAKTRTRKTLPKPAFTLKQERSHRFRSLTFPEVEGKKTSSVQMITSDDYHAVYIVFEDNTAVGFEIEPFFTIQAFAGDIEAVGRGAKKIWPQIRSER